MKAVAELRAQHVSVLTACAALSIPRCSYYRSRHPVGARPKPRPRGSHRALSDPERSAVLEVLHGERFVDRAPPAVVATLLEEGHYLCSARTMYRILASRDEVRERRAQARRPHYTRPEQVATAPNQVWTWDLTKLRGPEKWTYYILYVVLDLYSRLIVAWMLAHRESGELARDLFDPAYAQQSIQPGHLVVHADRGSAPTAKTLLHLFADLGVSPSFSRPRVSNDNPFTEAQFKTLKYAPGYPQRFGSYEHGLSWCRHFVPWYNTVHRHSALAYLSPAQVHSGQAQAVLDHRRSVLERARARHPERFVHGRVALPSLPRAVWINPPEDRARADWALAAGRGVSAPARSGPRAVQRSGPRIAEGHDRNDRVRDAGQRLAHRPTPTQEDLH